MRRRQHGNLWVPIGLHGGLVGGWFLLQKGLLELQAAAPAWLVGPGQGDLNPIGGLLGWLGLLLLMLAIASDGKAPKQWNRQKREPRGKPPL
jgi:hypothetical protein